ncbi:MAG: adenylate/guanylate cyclase protein [Conexibacter sp.]|nr:adenylate/guanylate cyclase protein [Conexibacter sp.]
MDRCFAFLDLCGFTSFLDQRGEREGVGVVAAFRATVRRAADHSGVRVTKWLGDGVMLTGPDAGAVARCASEIADGVAAGGVLALRGGLARGRVLLFEGDDYIGGPVNVAARLADAAAPGQILVGRSVADALDDEFTCVSIGDLPVRGFTAPLPVYAISKCDTARISDYSNEL